MRKKSQQVPVASKKPAGAAPAVARKVVPAAEPTRLGAVPSGPTSPASAAPAAPTAAEISKRAYEIFLRRGGVHGNDLEDWLAAEREIRSERTKPRA